MKTKYENHKLNAASKRNSSDRQYKPVFLLLGLTIILGLIFPTTALADTDNLAITVLVFNFRRVPSEILLRAENEAGRILEKAGIHVAWKDCPTGNEPCQKGPGRVFILAMMADPIQNKFMDAVSGYAILPDHLAAVYYDDLPRVPGGKSNSNKHDTAMVLGCVITHELGHLLLGARNHSIGGIMQAHWGVEQTRLALMSQLAFLPEEAKLMRTASQMDNEQRNAPEAALTTH